MSSEDKALELLRSINSEIVSTLASIKEKRNDSNTMDSASTIKLQEILSQMKQAKNHILTFMNRYDKQSTLTQFADTIN